MKIPTHLTLGLALAVSCAAAFAGPTLDRVTQKGELTGVLMESYPPFSFLNDQNQLDGFDVDVAKAVAERLGVKLKLGAHYRVAGPHLTAPSPQRTPLLIQAGWSGRGREFAAKHAELIFIAKSNPQEIRQGLEDIWTQAEARGRQREDVKSLTVLRIVTAKTEIEAQRKYDELQSNYHLQAQLVSYAGDTGIDISRYADSDALSTHTEGLTSYVMRPDGSGKPLTAGDVKKRFASVTRGSDLILVGTPQQVAERIEEHARISGTSGYMLNPLISPGSLEDFVELVIPELQKRGLYRTQPQSGTFRSRLRADHSSHLPASAYGASFRFDKSLHG